MNNTTIQLKIKQRLNKLDSQDYDNIEPWQIVEAFNKAQVMWCRRQIHGYNLLKEGDEGSKIRIDDLQVLLKEKELKLFDKGIYEESEYLPEDYFQYKRISTEGKSDGCSNTHSMVCYLAEEANVNELLRDENRKPSFSWGETFCTIIGNKIRIYTNKEFSLGKAKLTYYKMPVYIQIKGYVDPYTKKKSTKDVECVFKDDVVEVIIDEAVKIISGDIESFNIQTIASTETEQNN